jgi:hypothetical protein
MKLYGFGPTRSLRALWELKELDADSTTALAMSSGSPMRPIIARAARCASVPG